MKKVFLILGVVFCALPLLVANDITGVCDMGGDANALMEWNKEIAAGALVTPHLVAALKN